MIGFVLDAASYLQYYGHPFVPLPHLCPSPAMNAIVGAWKVHEVATANWIRESTAINLLMTKILRALDQVALSWFYFHCVIVTIC